MSGKFGTRIKGPPGSAGDSIASPRKKAAVLTRPDTTGGKAKKEGAENSSHEDLLTERNFLISLLQQAKQEREKFIETIKEKDLILKEKDTKLSKLTHRTMAEEQAFRETLAEIRLDFDTRLLAKDHKIKKREILICDLVEIVATTELYSDSSDSALSDVIIRAVDTVPTAKYTVESVCKTQRTIFERSVGASAQQSGYRAARERKITALIAAINSDPELRRPISKQTKKKKKATNTKKKAPLTTQSEPSLHVIESEADENTDSMAYSLSEGQEDDIDDNDNFHVSKLASPQLSNIMGMESYIAGGAEGSNYSIMVGSEPSVSKEGLSLIPGKSFDVTLGSYSENIEEPSISKATNITLGSYASSDGGTAINQLRPTAAERSTSSVSILLDPQISPALLDQGSHFIHSSDSGSLADSKRQRQKQQGGGTGTENLPYWWSSLSQPNSLSSP